MAAAGSRARARNTKTAKRKLPAQRSRFAFVTDRPGRALLALGVTAVVTGVVFNALFLQMGPHPAPLFAAAPRTAPPVQRHIAQLPPPALTPTPVPRPVQLTTSRISPHAAPTDSAPVEKSNLERDQIGSLLRGTGVTRVSTGADGAADRVSAAQQALQHLGYEVAVDGVFGAGTKAAVQQFERDRRLPITGELNARTLSALAERSGVPVP